MLAILAQRSLDTFCRVGDEAGRVPAWGQHRVRDFEGVVLPLGLPNQPELVPSCQARVYDRRVGPAFHGFPLRFDSPDNASAAPDLGIVWALRQSRRFSPFFPAALLCNCVT